MSVRRAQGFYPGYFGFCSNGGVYIAGTSIRNDPLSHKLSVFLTCTRGAGLCQSPYGNDMDGFAAAGGLNGRFNSLFGQCNNVQLIYINGVCAPTTGFAYNPYTYAAVQVTSQSGGGFGGSAVLRRGGFSVVGRILAVLVPGRLAQPAQPAPPAAVAGANASAPDGALGAAMESLFASSQRCPLDVSSGGALARALDALAPRCNTTGTAALCGACISGAQAALLRSAWRALPGLAPGTLADARAQAACGRAVVDALAARGVAAATLRAAGSACGAFAGRAECGVPDLPATATPLLQACRTALTAATSFNATTAAYCGTCFWPSLALVLNAAPLSDAFWCAAARVRWGDVGADDIFFAALLEEPSYGACVANLQALSRVALGADVLADARAAAHQGRCWEAAYLPRSGHGGLLSAETKARAARARCGA